MSGIKRLFPVLFLIAAIIVTALVLTSCGSSDAAGAGVTTETTRPDGYRSVVEPDDVTIHIIDPAGTKDKLEGDWPKVATWCEGDLLYAVTNELHYNDNGAAGGGVTVVKGACRNGEMIHE